MNMYRIELPFFIFSILIKLAKAKNDTNKNKDSPSIPPTVPPSTSTLPGPTKVTTAANKDDEGLTLLGIGIWYYIIMLAGVILICLGICFVCKYTNICKKKDKKDKLKVVEKGKDSNKSGKESSTKKSTEEDSKVQVENEKEGSEEKSKTQQSKTQQSNTQRPRRKRRTRPESVDEPSKTKMKKDKSSKPKSSAGSSGRGKSGRSSRPRSSKGGRKAKS